MFRKSLKRDFIEKVPKTNFNILELANMKLNRENIMNEIISSEEIYFDSLGKLYDIEYLLDEEEIITKKEVDQIFKDCKIN